MKKTLYAIVPGSTRDEAIENAHQAFRELCPTKTPAGGTNPIFDWYRLYIDLLESDEKRYPTPEDDGIHSTSENETEELLDAVWQNMVDELQSFEDEQNDFGNKMCTATRARRYLIYDDQARPVMSPVHYNNLVERDDHWVVAAWFSW